MISFRRSSTKVPAPGFLVRHKGSSLQAFILLALNSGRTQRVGNEPGIPLKEPSFPTENQQVISQTSHFCMVGAERIS